MGQIFSDDPTCLRFSIMTVHTEISELNLSQFLMPTRNVILIHSKFSMYLHGNWTTYWCLLHHSSSVFIIYIINQKISTSCPQKQLTSMPFSSSFWCFQLNFTNCTFVKMHLTASYTKCIIQLLYCPDIMQVHLNTF